MDFIVQKILNPSFLITLFRYALVALGGWLANEHGFDPGQWETISGALLVIVGAVLGGTESTKNKAVVDGKNVEVSKLPVAVREELKDAVDKKPARSIIDIFLGK